jgi:hypothetical protein
LPVAVLFSPVVLGAVSRKTRGDQKAPRTAYIDAQHV